MNHFKKIKINNNYGWWEGWTGYRPNLARIFPDHPWIYLVFLGTYFCIPLGYNCRMDVAHYYLDGNADAVEFCPHYPHHQILAAATYTLQEGDQAHRSGSISLFSVGIDTGLKLLHHVETAGVFDIKWNPDGANIHPLLAQADADGYLRLHGLGCDPEVSEGKSISLFAFPSMHSVRLSLFWWVKLRFYRRKNAMHRYCTYMKLELEKTFSTTTYQLVMKCSCTLNLSRLLHYATWSGCYCLPPR